MSFSSTDLAFLDTYRQMDRPKILHLKKKFALDYMILGCTGIYMKTQA